MIQWTKSEIYGIDFAFQHWPQIRFFFTDERPHPIEQITKFQATENSLVLDVTMKQGAQKKTNAWAGLVNGRNFPILRFIDNVSVKSV